MFNMFKRELKRLDKYENVVHSNGVAFEEAVMFWRESLSERQRISFKDMTDIEVIEYIYINYFNYKL